MKKPIFFLLPLLLCLSFIHKPSTIDKLVKDKMTRINYAYFCDKYEVSNDDWREYRQEIGKKYGFSSQEYIETAQDTTVWRNGEVKYPDPITDVYHIHAAYSKYPVVGVSYEQVQDYIQWRTTKINEALIKAGINETITLRLPHKEEWEDMAAKEIDSRFKHKFEKQNAKNEETLNFKSYMYANCAFYMITAPVNEFYPNTLGLYNMRGNVSEMLQEKGKAKGGSWLDREVDSPISKDFEYDKPKSWLGFRLIMLVNSKS